MIPAKESLIFFEQLQPKQRRVVENSRDYGIPLTSDNKETIRYHLNELLQYYKGVDFNYMKKTWLGGSDLSFNIPFEIDHGVRFTFTYNEMPEFITIELDRY